MQRLTSVYVLIPPASSSPRVINSPVQYCTCSLILDDSRIVCSSPSCPIKYFHRACVDISDEYTGEWTCPSCTSTPVPKTRRRKAPRQVRILYAATDESIVESVIEMSYGRPIDPSQRTRLQREGEASEGIVLTEEEEMHLQSLLEQSSAHTKTSQKMPSRSSKKPRSQDPPPVDTQPPVSVEDEDTLMEDAPYGTPVNADITALDGSTLNEDVAEQNHPEPSPAPSHSSQLSEDQYRHAQLVGYEAANTMSPTPTAIRTRWPGWKLISIEEDEARRAITAGFFVPVILEREDGRMVLGSFVRRLNDLVV